jgi:hypothetical protein
MVILTGVGSAICTIGFALLFAYVDASCVETSSPVVGDPVMLEEGVRPSGEKPVERPWDRYLLNEEDEWLPLLLQLRSLDFSWPSRLRCSSEAEGEGQCAVAYIYGIDSCRTGGRRVVYVQANIDEESVVECGAYVMCRMREMIGVELEMPECAGGDGWLIEDKVVHRRGVPNLRQLHEELEVLEVALSRPVHSELAEMPVVMQRLERFLRAHNAQQVEAIRLRLGGGKP